MAVEVILTITSRGILDLRIGDGVDADVAVAVPNECLHGALLQLVERPVTWVE